ncbi:MAG: DUF4249 domain-containing protein [Chlorobi bacterium]|nr:DUF4249 domain-containing protein [Chlorobiota bacterium]
MKGYNTEIFMGIILAFLMATVLSCSEEIDVELPQPEKLHYSVEGFIEDGQPPIILLTKTLAFTSVINIDTLINRFVSGATMYITTEGTTYQLQEIKVKDLPPAIQKEIATAFGFSDPEPIAELSFYTTRFTPLPELVGKAGNTYHLTIISPDGKDTLTATTYIPARKLKLDSLWTKSVNDSMANMWAIYSDPPEIGDIVRYYTSINGGPFCAPFGGAIDDRYFNGATITIELDRGVCNRQDPEEYNPETFGLYHIGDTVVVKWCNIDEYQYKFWLTFEGALTAIDNPFASPVRIESNVNGGYGIWGGSNCSFDTIVVNPN